MVPEPKLLIDAQGARRSTLDARRSTETMRRLSPSSIGKDRSNTRDRRQSARLRDLCAGARHSPHRALVGARRGYFVPAPGDIAESFFASLRKELTNRVAFPTRDAARSSVFEYVEAFYNRVRRHSTINYQSPMDFENGTSKSKAA
jgi:hypothetical protein